MPLGSNFFLLEFLRARVSRVVVRSDVEHWPLNHQESPRKSPEAKENSYFFLGGARDSPGRGPLEPQLLVAPLEECNSGPEVLGGVCLVSSVK